MLLQRVDMDLLSVFLGLNCDIYIGYRGAVICISSSYL